MILCSPHWNFAESLYCILNDEMNKWIMNYYYWIYRRRYPVIQWLFLKNYQYFLTPKTHSCSYLPGFQAMTFFYAMSDIHLEPIVYNAAVLHGYNAVTRANKYYVVSISIAVLITKTSTTLLRFSWWRRRGGNRIEEIRRLIKKLETRRIGIRRSHSRIIMYMFQIEIYR